MSEYQEVNIAVRMRVLRAGGGAAPGRGAAESAALQAVTKALLVAERAGFDHDRGELAVVFKEAEPLPAAEGDEAGPR